MPRPVIFRFLADADQLEQTFRSLDAAGGRLQRVGASMQRIGSRMTLGVTAPLLLLGKAATAAASDLEESMNKVRVVFGKSGESIVSWSKGAAKNMGVSQQKALEAAGTFGNLFRAMQVGEQPATNMSKHLIQLASDLASFNNADPTEVLEALRSGLVGETEPLRRFGINLSAARVEAEAFALGLAQPARNVAQVKQAHLQVEQATRNLAKAQKEHGKESLQARTAANALELAHQKLEKAMAGQKAELTSAQKAQATYSLIMKDSTLAQGDFARTADGAANKARIQKAQFEDLQATIGQKLLPIKIRLLDALGKLLGWFEKLSPAQQNTIVQLGLVAAAAGPVVTVVGTLIRVGGTLVSTLGALNAVMLANPVGIVVAAIAAFAAILVVAYQKSETFRRIVHTSFEGVRIIAAALATGAITAFQALTTVWLGSVEAIVTGAAKAFGWVPGLGPKLVGAAEAVGRFRTETNARLGEIKDKVTVAILGDASDLGREIRHSRDAVEALRHPKPVKIRVDTSALSGLAKQVRDSIPDEVYVRIKADTGNINALAGARAHGGPVWPGGAFLVGERGPEVFVPDRAGTIVPNHRLDRQASARADRTVNINVHGDIAQPLDEERLLTLLRRAELLYA